MSAPASDAQIRRTELAISLVLRIGVTISVAVIAVGLGLMFAHHPEYASITGHLSYQKVISPSTHFPHTFGELGESLGASDGSGVIVLGVLLLISTPVMRVAVAVLAFALERDVAMTAVTIFVLSALIVSFILGGALS